MKYSGLYFIPNPTTNLDTSLNTVSTLVQSIETNFQNASREAQWTLSYRVFRDTTPRDHTAPNDADGKPKPFAHTYQHILHHSVYGQNRTYLYTQPPGDQGKGKGIVASIPSRQQDAYATLVRYQQAALWTPRHILSVQAGTAYTSGLCTIYIGELRATREGPQSGGVSSPAVVVCISTGVGAADTVEDSQDSGYQSVENGADGDGDEGLDVEYAQSVIRDCWSKITEGRDLGRSEIREVMMALEDVNSVQERDAAVRMWCEVLRMRG
ncbi:uncharacterized protein K460DRAFT_383767 [Cucurbitaria berberidis CBS 394.84]|uniref:Mediator of RNA polymerase II transcription subunit 20 n=1 Tax=Cucurbitaria berberidis CBS 394.84 TaxID=1168544 RepID=A0A9P4LAG7_9PLEO|nr:uncharacterized protein K460DRAFT_383767 [Cucurbitaria berberidis CBS 394.84]KAF1847342.1 hypothetical protein K460DRAFT_383767 [Cucurbitaria berberidis CBS 394.84]